MSEEKEYLTVKGLMEELLEIEENGWIRYRDYFGEELYQFMFDLRDGKINTAPSKGNDAVTENGAKILKYLQTLEKDVQLTAKAIAEGMGVNSRSVSGGMRKLVSGGYVSKESGNPITYTLTDKGWEYK